MEIFRGILEDISRPASTERASSRMSSVSLAQSDRISPTTPFSLVVLTNDAVDIQVIKLRRYNITTAFVLWHIFKSTNFK